MPYPSIDQLQKVLAKDVFGYAADAKKAAGRALGTLVELITFYSLKSWGFEREIAIERKLPEFANAGITHNVEYSLHPATVLGSISFDRDALPLTTGKILKDELFAQSAFPNCSRRPNVLLTKNLILRNACTVCDLNEGFVNAYLNELNGNQGHLTVVSLRGHPYAIIECKRVGIEEGMKKGPQTIEKAKQGAYVARAVSSLQRVRFRDGRIGGFIQSKDGATRCEEYYTILAEIIGSEDAELLSRFVLTVGVVSNHGNWFTSFQPNKELKVLAQSYDWLVFLTDKGLAQFVDEVLLNPPCDFVAARDAFLASYKGTKGGNQFTKVRIALAADAALQSYFEKRRADIEDWFNIIAPSGQRLDTLRTELTTLRNKKWREIVP